MATADQVDGALPGEQDDTRIHVAQLLQEQVGAVRQRRVAVAEVPIDEGLTAHDVAGVVRLTRIPAGVLAKGRLGATVGLQCIRCLDEYEQAIEVEFADQYRPTVDIHTGAELAQGGETDDDAFPISDLHILDLRESIRQALALELPMAPLCRDDCPGLPEAANLRSEGDARLAVLGRLLVDDDDGGRE